MYGTRDAESNLERDWQARIESCGYQGLSLQNLFRREEHRVSGMTHGDRLRGHGAGRSARRSQQQNCRGVQKKKKQKSSVTGQRKASKHCTENCTREAEKLCICTLRDVLVNDLGLEHGSSMPLAVHDVADEEPEPLDQVPSSKYRSCRQNVHCERFLLLELFPSSSDACHLHGSLSVSYHLVESADQIRFCNSAAWIRRDELLWTARSR